MDTFDELRNLIIHQLHPLYTGDDAELIAARVIGLFDEIDPEYEMGHISAYGDDMERAVRTRHLCARVRTGGQVELVRTNWRPLADVQAEKRAVAAVPAGGDQ